MYYLVVSRNVFSGCQCVKGEGVGIADPFFLLRED